MFRFLFRILLVTVLYCWWIEPARLSISQHRVSDPDQPLARPVRVLLLTDWHLGRWSHPRVLQAKLKRLLRLHRRKSFDVMLLGGDFIDHDPRCLAQLPPLLQQLRQFQIPVFAVLGNHDYTSFSHDVSPLVKCLEAQGVKVLRNEATPITVGSQRLLIVGLDDLQEAETYYNSAEYKSPAQYRQAASNLTWYAQLDDMEPDLPRLLLAHNPDAVYLQGRKPLAVLAGHTHGGQIMLLDWVSRHFHRPLNFMLPPGSAITQAGRQEIQGRALIVSRGIGGAALPLRLMRSPEAVVVTLE